MVYEPLSIRPKHEQPGTGRAGPKLEHAAKQDPRP